MATIGVTIGREGREQLRMAIGPGPEQTGERRVPRRRPSIHAALAQLGDVIVLHRADGTRVTRTVHTHWPPEEWQTILNGFRAGEYIRTNARELVFTE